MSNYVHIKTDAVDAYNKFLKVNFEVMSKYVTKATRAGLAAVQKDVRANLSSSLKGTNKRGYRTYMGKRINFEDTLQQGVRLGRLFIDPESSTVEGSVKITSTGKTNSGSYRLHILEGGSFKTGVRHTKTYTYNGITRKLKKPRSTGRLRAYNFFKTATNGNKFGTTVANVLSKTHIE